MEILSALSAFKRYALLEKEMRPMTYQGIALVIKWLHADTEIKTVRAYNTSIIRNFLYNRREQRLWSTKSVINYRQYLKTFFDFCVKENYVAKNPVEAIDKPKLPERLPRCLTDEQIRKLLSCLVYHPWRSPQEYFRNEAIIRTFLLAGLRLSELRNLAVADLNLIEGKIYVRNGKGRKDRLVPIHPSLNPYLKKWLQEGQKKRGNSEYIFTSLRSPKRLTLKNLYAIFRHLRRDCDFHFTPHQLRHTFARLSLEAGLNPYQLKEILGHSQITTTEIYMSVSGKNLQKSFSKLNLL